MLSKVSKPGFPKWKKAILKSKSIREKQTIDDWNSFTEFCRPTARGVSKLTSDTSSSMPFPPCDLAKGGSEDFAFPFSHSIVLGAQVELEDSIATGISAGYPEFLCRLEVGVDSLEFWLGKVERLVLDRSEYSSLGKLFQMGSYSIHGLMLWTALMPIPEIRLSAKLFACWRRLIGKPILEFLQLDGILTNELWLDFSPPCLSELGAAIW